ncbi:hypothetical protein FACS1894102_5610 [Spirochaetia bacterium]|nr:hypothetical protein FACS1894102_5610 [Spirochaetia bacterium]
MGILFWVLFFVVIISLFAINLPLIKRTFNTLNVPQPSLKDFSIGDKDIPPPANGENASDTGTVIVANDDAQGDPSVILNGLQPAEIADNAVQESVVSTSDSTLQQSVQTLIENKNNAITVGTAAQKPMADERERVIYFAKIDGNGIVFMSPVKRIIRVSDSPMLDALNTLLAGTTENEGRLDIQTLIPGGTKIISARVNNTTATINFSEAFMFNRFGAEGYIAGLKQIIWTATEFPNVTDVQILIEGQKVDYLGDSINIGRPLNRNSL